MNASRFGNFQGVILLTDLIGKMVSIEEWLICLNDKLVFSMDPIRAIPEGSCL